MAKATWKGQVLADSDAVEEVEGNKYFPPDSVNNEYFEESNTQTECPWKGTAHYYHIKTPKACMCHDSCIGISHLFSRRSPTV